MSIQAYPLQWPTGWKRAPYRDSARFHMTEQKAFSADPSMGSYRGKRDITMEDAIKRVHYELQRLGVASADDFVVSTNLKLTMSGRPRADQGEPTDPGVALYWNQGKHNRVMAIDRYDRVRDNIAAIAATLEAMRAIERHGGATILERAFTGFAALEAPKTCWQILGVAQDAAPDTINEAFRNRARSLHPDAGGDHGQFAELSAARDEALRAAAA